MASPRVRGLIGRSLAMRKLFGLVARVAETDATVLLEGETGVGKGAFARAIHRASKRREGPFTIVDCGSVQRQLVESELFGHEKGAFSGAYQQRIGAFECAHQGTIFIDELGELDLEMQPKLLRVLDAREVRRIGGDRSIPINIRIVAASRRDLAREVERGAFREDLFFRLSVITLTIPPLRERAEDIPPLVEAFVKEVAEKRGIPPPVVQPRDPRSAHEPRLAGNVRELRNTLERRCCSPPLGRVEACTSTGFSPARPIVRRVLRSIRGRAFRKRRSDGSTGRSERT
ncbi:MAG: sigma-54-dependent Fis family transcriptional regulator [Myxococcales bacterium]|nr:sigma-54-dependent Fis family transcriptional regulator [Myxococcales bacterium]